MYHFPDVNQVQYKKALSEKKNSWNKLLLPFCGRIAVQMSGQPGNAKHDSALYELLVGF